MPMHWKFERIRYFREAGYVKRYHTMPLVGDNSYTVGKHSYDALSLLLVLHPNPSINLIKAVLWHDTAERWLGDMPAPAKWDNKHLASIYERVEAQILETVEALPRLTEDDQRWLKTVDRLELWLFCLEQLYMGNKNVETATNNIFNALMNMDRPGIVIGFMDQWSVSRTPEHAPIAPTVDA